MSLLWLLLIPTIGAVAIAACPRERPRAAKWVFGVAAGLVLLWVAVLVGWFQTSAGAQWTVRLEWLEEPWPVAWELGVDGFNLFFLGLTALFTLLSGIASFDREDDGRGLLGLLLLLEAATLGLFLAQDLISFYIFWDLMLVPPFLLMLGWGGEARRQAAWRYILYNGAGGLALLLSIVAVGAAGHGFQLSALWGGTLEAGGGAAGAWDAWVSWAFLGMAFAFVVKIPLFPFHGWMPATYRESPVSITAFLSGVQSKAGLYGLLRVALPLFPATFQAFAPVIAGLALCGVVYGAVVALVQRGAKDLVAYSSLSHLGLVAVAIAVAEQTALQGALLQMVNHAVFAGGLFLVLGMIEARTGDLTLARLGGLARGAPALATGFVIIVMAALGLPGLSGFAGEFVMLNGIVGVSMWYTVIALVAIVVAAAYMLRLYQGVMEGPLSEAAKAPEWHDIGWRERLILAPVVLFVIWLGVQPRPVTERVAPAVAAVTAVAATATAPEGR